MYKWLNLSPSLPLSLPPSLSHCGGSSKSTCSGSLQSADTAEPELTDRPVSESMCWSGPCRGIKGLCLWSGMCLCWEAARSRSQVRSCAGQTKGPCWNVCLCWAPQLI